jgi:hypothetical protein
LQDVADVSFASRWPCDCRGAISLFDEYKEQSVFPHALGGRERTMSMPQNVVAVVFDFDDTLTDDSTTKLLEAHGVDAVDFWQNLMK